MCNVNVIVFLTLNVKPEEIKGKNVIEVGAADVNGSIRPIFESYGPYKYLGVDIAKGKGVDIVCKAENLLDLFSPNSFDVLISTEMLEHVNNWKKVMSSFKRLVKPGGMLLLTTRSFGFPYHGYPYDFWRYEVDDFEKIFSDCTILKLLKEPMNGIFAKIVKPSDFVENALGNYQLYSMITCQRVKENTEADIRRFILKYDRQQRRRTALLRLLPMRIIRRI